MLQYKEYQQQTSVPQHTYHKLLEPRHMSLVTKFCHHLIDINITIVVRITCLNCSEGSLVDIIQCCFRIESGKSNRIITCFEPFLECLDVFPSKFSSFTP